MYRLQPDVLQLMPLLTKIEMTAGTADHYFKKIIELRREKMNRFFKSLFMLNILSLLLSIVYSFFPGESVFWNSYGLILIVTLTGNTVASVLGSRYRKLDITYLLLSSIGLLVVMLSNTAASVLPTYESSRSILSISILLLLLVVGAAITRVPLIRTADRQSRTTLSADRPEKKTRKAARRVLLVLLAFILLIGALMVILTITDINVGVAEILLSQYSLFYSFIFLSIAGLLLKLTMFKWNSLVSYVVFSLGINLFVLFAIPFVFMPSLLNEAEKNYTESFGDEWQTYGADVPAFKEMPFSIPAYFFGISSKDYNLTEDVLFYEGTEGVDAGLELRFDVYTPPADAANLPGERSTLIRIHGGGWDIGDKGTENFAQVNKYFAGQGYVVFDVQYGLNNQDQFVEFLTVPDRVSGDFSIDDMVRHLGLFTTYLADNHEEYGANIDSVFLSGASAGGQLASAVALGSSSGDYTDIIDNRITVKGLIPFYPANGLSQYRNIGGESELVDPALMVEADSPPALVYQGEKDGLVAPRVAELFRESYLEKGNTEIAVIWMPYGEHASDLYFPGFYNQTFIYYMERFMYQYQ
ncbi:alpha/beta hydrolase [Alkalibacterium sp. 20]|uniref:alpha/beta hydrolase n=1 Tax=Alkalibacterium sp. 20 TaxID=1798803 RepID=UPI0015A5FDB0|nr:alpha/beta hydrolase [Alkalibacterium sp. 20]